MSLKWHQNSGGSSSGGGRRTPLSLNPKATKIVPQEIIDLDTIDNLPLSQSMSKVIKQSNIMIDAAKGDKKSSIPIMIEKQQQQQQQQVSSTSNVTNELKNVKKDNSNIDSSGDKNIVESKKHENGHNNNNKNNTESKPTNGQHKQIADVTKKPDQNNGNMEISNEKKAIVVKGPPTPVSDSKSNEINLSSNSEKSTVEVEPPKEKSGLKLKKAEKKKNTEENGAGNGQTVLSSPPKRAQRAAAIVANASIASISLTYEKELKGFNENGDEMESLLFDVEEPLPLPIEPISSNTTDMATKVAADAKKVREAETPVIIDSPISPIEMNEPSKEQVALSPPITSTPDGGKHFYNKPPSSLRSITGRRSLRPMKEYSFQSSNYRESYRKINSELDSTGNTSMDVTVGSEISAPNESYSFSFFGRGKKRERTATQQPIASTSTATDICDDSELNTSTNSPTKRARLDFSGFFGLVISPVTMLRARLSRATIQTSPESGLEKSSTEDLVENVSDEINIGENESKMIENITESTDKVAVLKECDDLKEIADVEMNDIGTVEGKKDEKSLVDGEEMKEILVNNTDDAEIVDEDIVDEDIVITEIPRRNMCLIM